MNIDPLLLIMAIALAFSAGAAFGGWYVQREAKGPLDQGREWSEPDDNQLAVKDEREPRMFCLSCGATHYKQICPFCDSDAQDPL